MAVSTTKQETKITKFKSFTPTSCRAKSAFHGVTLWGPKCKHLNARRALKTAGNTWSLMLMKDKGSEDLRIRSYYEGCSQL